MSWRMPAQTQPQSRIWMAWPCGGYALGAGGAQAEQARRAWADVANTIAEHEAVSSSPRTVNCSGGASP